MWFDAGRDGLAEDGDGAVRVLGRPQHAGAGQLHRAVADPVHGAVAEGVLAGLLRGRRHARLLPAGSRSIPAALSANSVPAGWR